MRIRKNTNISELLKATSSPKTQKLVQTHNCQLNQSPWDVISNFSAPSIHPPLPPPPLYQVNQNEALPINASSRDSVLERFKSQLDDSMKFDGTTCKRDYANGGKEENQRDGHMPTNLCCKTDGKSWQCRNGAAKGSSMCKHHSSLQRISDNNKKLVYSSESSKRCGRPKKANSSNPYGFYYYSGFGPRWSKKRGSDINDVGKNSENELGIEPSLYKFVHEDFVCIENYDEELQEKHVKKKVRKPIKERSLKSLM